MFVGHVWPLIRCVDWTPTAAVCVSRIYQSISHPTQDLREICLKRPHLPCCTTPLHQGPGFMILCGQWWELTHLYVAERATVGGRAILLPSAPHRATVAHCPHWFQLAGGATAEPVKTQGRAFRSCQLRLSALVHKLTRTIQRAKKLDRWRWKQMKE